MKIQLNQMSTDFCGERCYVHARGLILPGGNGIITLQKLELSGCDVFYGIEMMKTSDYGESFSKPTPCKNLGRRYHENGTSTGMSDATPFFHKKSGKILLTGHTVVYGENNALLPPPRPRSTVYAVYDTESGDFGEFKELITPDEESQKYFSEGAGCTQILELPNSELLIPTYYRSYETACDRNGKGSVTVFRCSFDGEELRVLEVGNELSVNIPRGLGEPSVIRYGEEYFLCLRNDETGFVARSKDGLHFEPPTELCFSDGESLGNYNTQQHWLAGGGRLFLVYTRRAENNGHIFRHRAPLFIAEFDPFAMRVKRETEKIAVPERGARLGNFGCQSFSDEVGYIFASEWMQNGSLGWESCALRGSDNSIFLAKILYE